MKSQLLPAPLRKHYYRFRKGQFLSQQKSWKQIVDFRGAKFFAGPDNKLEQALLDPYGSYDRNNFVALEKLVQKGDVCFDIGANIGIYSVILSRLSGDPSHIHSFEPVNHIREKLIANCKLNRFDGININDFALGAKEATMEMYQVKEGLFRGGTSTFVENDNVGKMGKDKFDLSEVKITTLDKYAESRGLDRLNFIKIDVEGFEWPVLQGAQDTIRKFAPTILIEYDPIRHKEDGENNRFKEFFQDHKYQAYEFTAFGSELTLLPFDFDHTPIQRNILCFNPDLAG